MADDVMKAISLGDERIDGIAPQVFYDFRACAEVGCEGAIARQAREAYRALSGVLDACGVAVRQAVDRAAIHEQRAPLHLVRIGLAALVREKSR